MTKLLRPTVARLIAVLAAYPCAGADPVPDPPSTFRTTWLESRERRAVDLRVDVEDQDGFRHDLAALVNRPTAAAFFYTRCGNLRKCPVTVGRMAELQAAARRAGLGDSVRLLLLTYEPEVNTPPTLRAYGNAHGFRPDVSAKMLAPAPAQKVALLDRLDAAVNFDGALVNTHGLELFVLDGRGRLVRKYHTLIWDNTRVLDDLRRLLAEPSSAR